MPDIAGIPYYEVTFAADGTLSSDGGLPAAVAGGTITNLFIFSHGWNDGESSARGLYQDMFTLIAGMLPRCGQQLRVRRDLLAVAAVP